MTVGNFLQLWHDRNRCASCLGESSVPPAHGKQVHTHTTINFDGREVAKNTAKHFVKMGQGPAMGPRLPDYSATRPISGQGPFRIFAAQIYIEPHFARRKSLL
jgi:hypothetical protein